MKRDIPRAFFDPLGNIQASDLLENVELLDMIKIETPLAIQEAFKSRKTFATLFEISGTGMYLDIPKQYWSSALEQCIRFKLEEEKFEDCIKLRDLIEEIKKPAKTINKKISKNKADGTIPE